MLTRIEKKIINTMRVKFLKLLGIFLVTNIAGGFVYILGWKDQGKSQVPTAYEVHGTAKSNSKLKKNRADKKKQIVIAEFIESKVIRKRSYLDAVKRSNDLSAAIGGRLYIFKIRINVCESELKRDSEDASSSQIVLFFNEDGSGFYRRYEAGKSYLIHLDAYANQSSLWQKFEVEDGVLLYKPFIDRGERKISLINTYTATSEDEETLNEIKKEC